MKKRTVDDTPYMDTYAKTATPAGYRFPGAPYILKAGTAPVMPVAAATEESKKSKKGKK
jgi:hypothetical protein